MRFLFQYLRGHLYFIFIQLLFVCIFAVVFCLYRLPLTAVLYPACICLAIGLLLLGKAVIRAYGKHRQLLALQGLSGSELPGLPEEGGSIEEQDYLNLIKGLCREMQSMEYESSASRQEMLEYFTVWVHQIKTPISSMRLHLEAEDTRLCQRLKSDLLHIEQYVEMVLTYLKMGSEATDYVFRTVDLDTLIRENIRRLRSDFIMKKLKLVYIPVNAAVITDEKWLSFVLGQLLSNALKYTHEGSVTISMEEPETLCIRDTGIGIAPEDIPRIFEKGYTGCNGHRDKRASGLGLYLCSQICSRLGHELLVESQVEKGTTVRLNLSRCRIEKNF